jgi:molecular chaperone DnaK (HSP70)
MAFFNGSLLTIAEPDVDGEHMRGGRVYPSVVMFDRDGFMLAAGWLALAQGTLQPQLMVSQVKRWIGKSFDDIQFDPRIQKLGYPIINDNGKPVAQMGSKAYTAEEIVTYMLTYIIRDGINSLRRKGVEINDEVTVIVTYPAYYAQNQVDAIREAVKNVKEQLTDINFDSVRLIPEPVASICAAMYEGRVDRNDRYVMVIDEGAGTLDTLVVDMQSIDMKGKSVLKGISIGGRAMLGGTDMDYRIMEWVLGEIKKDQSQEEIDKINTCRLRAVIESAKIDISEGRTKAAQIRIPRLNRYIELREDKMNELIKPVIDDCRKEISRSLDHIEAKYNIKRSDIAKTILVGGPTKMAMFREMVKEVLPASTVINLNPMECVAEGAATSPMVSYSIPAERNYGLIRKGEREENFIEAIPKDTPLPAGDVIEWAAHPYAGSAIGFGQVLSEDGDEITILSMGSYTYPASAAVMVNYVVLKIDQERNVKLLMFNSADRARQNLNGELPDECATVRLEYKREISTRIVSRTRLAGP